MANRQRIKEYKAGLIPYYEDDDGDIVMLFMISSDPKFGGSRPMPSKGGVDKGETAKEAAIREAFEELGLEPSNIEHVKFVKSESYGYVNIEQQQVDVTVEWYYGRMKNPTQLVAHGYETSKVVRMTADEYAKRGRVVDRGLVHQVSDLAKADVWSNRR